MAFSRNVAVFIALCLLAYAACTVQRDKTVFTKLALLEEEMNAVKSSMQRNEKNRKTDLEILRHDINIKLEGVVSKVLSDIIDDKTKAGEIRGVVDSSVNTLVQHQQQQLHQLKLFVNSVSARRQPVPTPRKTEEKSSSRTNKRFRSMNKKLKRYENDVKDLKDEILQQNLKIIELESTITEHIKISEELRKKRNNRKTAEEKTATMTTTMKTTTNVVTESDRRAPPSFLMTPVNQVVGIGENVTLQCVVTGNPPPTVFWSKGTDQRLMFPNQENGRFSVDEDGTFRIQGVQFDDEGDYTCQALNVIGSAKAIAMIDVRETTMVTACEGRTAVMRCSYSKTDNPVIWRKGGVVLTHNLRRYTSDHRFSVNRPYASEWNLVLSLVKASDFGDYECTVPAQSFVSHFTLKSC